MVTKEARHLHPKTHTDLKAKGAIDELFKDTCDYSRV